MKVLLLLVVFCAVATAALSPQSAINQYHGLRLKSQFNNFAKKYNKIYPGLADYQERFAIFTQNVKDIEKHNSENHGWKMAINQFADLTGYMSNNCLVLCILKC